MLVLNCNTKISEKSDKHNPEQLFVAQELINKVNQSVAELRIDKIILTLMISGIISGILAGYIASRLQKGEGSGCLVNLFLGVIGGLVGGWLFSLIGIAAYGWIGEMITAIVGAVVVLWLFAKLR